MEVSSYVHGQCGTIRPEFVYPREDVLVEVPVRPGVQLRHIQGSNYERRTDVRGHESTRGRRGAEIGIVSEERKIDRRMARMVPAEHLFVSGSAVTGGE